MASFGLMMSLSLVSITLYVCKKALQIVGNDLVVNNPFYDGSLVLNSLYGMNIFYR